MFKDGDKVISKNEVVLVEDKSGDVIISKGAIGKLSTNVDTKTFRLTISERQLNKFQVKLVEYFLEPEVVEENFEIYTGDWG